MYGRNLLMTVTLNLENTTSFYPSIIGNKSANIITTAMPG